MMRFFSLWAGLLLFIPLAAQWRVQSFGAEYGLQGFYFSQVFTDHDNRLWTSSTFGIQRFDGQRFRNVGVPKYSTYLLQLRNGSFVYNTLNNELHLMRLKNHSWTDSLLAHFEAGTDQVRSMYEDADGSIWIGGTGLYHYRKGDSLARLIPNAGMLSYLLPVPGGLYVGTDRGILRLEGDSLVQTNLPFRNVMLGCTDRDGDHWFVSDDSMLVQMTTAGDVKKRIDLHRFDRKVSVTTAPVYDGSAGIYVGTTTGLMYYDMNTGECTWPEWKDEHFRTMPHCAIYSVFIVSPGFFWCSTWRGLLRVQTYTPGITCLPLSLGESNAPYRLRSVCALSADTIVGGAGNGSVYFFIRREGSWTTELFLSLPSTRANGVNTIVPDRQGGLWIGRNAGLQHVDIRTRTLRAYGSLVNVWCVYVDTGGTTWVTANVGTIWRMRPGETEFEMVVSRHQAGFYHICMDNGVMLLSSNTGVHYLDMRTLQFDTGHAEYEPLRHVSNGSCWSVSRDRGGGYYIAAQDSGLLHYDPRTERMQRLTPEGLAVFATVCDSAGQCWAITDKGLLQAGMNGKAPRIYDERDGLISADISFVGIQLRGNGVVLAGENGLTMTQSAALYSERKPAPVIIDHIEAGGRVLAEDLLNEATIDISYREQGINIHLCMPNARFPERYRYRYRVDNDSTWSSWSERPVFSFVSFSPGDYRLYFEVENADGYHNTVLNIHVPPPFWQTGFFYTATGSLLVLLVLAVAGLRIRAVRRHYHIEQTLLETQHKALRVQMNPHFIFNSLNSIQEFIIDHQSREANLYLGKFSMMMRQILAYSKRSTITLQEEIDLLTLYLELEQLRFGHGFEFTFTVSEEFDASATHIPPMLVQPIVENAVKHGLAGLDRPGKITVSFVPQGEHLLCTVEDNGRGREKVKRYSAPRGKEHESIGIENTIERLAILFPGKPGRPFVTITDLYIDDRTPAGTRVEIYIPLL